MLGKLWKSEINDGDKLLRLIMGREPAYSPTTQEASLGFAALHFISFCNLCLLISLFSIQ